MGNEWCENLLKDHRDKGKEDADRGIFEYPRDDNNDPQNESENNAYYKGFMDRRVELGDDFKWVG